MSKEELKPCPFCGGEASIGSDESDAFWGCKSACCNNCFCAMEPFKTESDAIAAWNTRTKTGA